MQVKMFKLGCEPIMVHKSQVQNAINRGWSLDPPVKRKERKKQTTKES